MQTISAWRRVADAKFRPRNRRNTVPGGPGGVPSLSPTFLQFNVCKRILFQSLAPSAMVLLERPRAVVFTSAMPTEVFPSVCHNMLFDLLKCEYNVGTS